MARPFPVLCITAALTVTAVLAACSAPRQAPAESSSANAAASSGTEAPAETEVPAKTQAPEPVGGVMLLAGSMLPGCADGAAAEAQFLKPYGICAGADGNLILADSYGNQLREIHDGTVTTLAGLRDGMEPVDGGFRSGAAAQALLNQPRFAAVDGNGLILFTDSENNMVRTFDGGEVRVLAGAPESGYADGDVKSARFRLPSGIVIGENGTVYVADTLNHCIRAISSDGMVRTLAGRGGEPGLADGPLEQARFREPNDIAFGPDGALYVVDKGNQRLRRISGGLVTTVAGSGTDTDKVTDYIIGGFQDGPAAQARFRYPTGLCAGEDGAIYVADTGNHCIRALMPDGQVVTVAGSVTAGNRTGSLRDARFNQPLDVLYQNGVLYVTDSYNHAVKAIVLDDFKPVVKGDAS